MKPLSAAVDPTEVRTPDDQATLHEAQHLEAAMLEQQRRAKLTPKSSPGVCSNCGAACLPRAVYCDEDCRADHEQRLVLERMRGRRA